MLHIDKRSMKTSINYLPEEKRDDLRRIVKCVLEVLPECEMIILYGSYARNTYVDYDQRIEYGVRTCFMSDYDILVVTKTRFQSQVINNILDKAANNYYKGKNRYESATIQFINENIDDLNKAILKNRYFYTDIKREGVMLYNSGRCKLARRRKLNFDEIQERAQKYYDDNFKPKAIEFILLNIDSYNRKNYKMASFNLHQATENLLRIIELVFTLYSPKEHRLTELMNRCKRFTTEIFKAFPRDTPEEERLFKLLERAYVESRYNPDFEITKEDIDALLPKVERLRDIVERVCTAQIDYYARQKNK